MNVLLGTLGLFLSLMMLVRRERVADVIGSAEWMEYVGGVYNFVTIMGIILFFASVAVLTGTIDLFLAPLTWLLPTPANDAVNLMP